MHAVVAGQSAVPPLTRLLGPQFAAGKPHGRGMHKASDGSVFIGTYENGLRSGLGAHDMPNGDR